ncbi:hypothetical protein [uncultured Tessaracoccus sp.]|uniref:hypothetical protein n=1 Tax=uncultured Tessaracoccus sp. TaxID=905023 RepID=UPI0025D62118|nr:hypothetical protein [uncultured Tessaracoccus sp.]
MATSHAGSRPKPPVPTLFTVVAVLLAVAVIAGAYVLGRQLGAPATPEPSPTPTPAPTLPEQLGQFALSASEPPSTAPGSEKHVVQGNFTDGTDKIVVLLTRPEPSLEPFLTDAGVTDLQTVGASTSPSPSSDGGDVMCGKSVDTGHAACGRLVVDEATGNTGQVVFAATDLSTDDVRALLEQLPG